MKKIISLLIAIGVIGCEKVKLVTPEEAEERERKEKISISSVSEEEARKFWKRIEKGKEYKRVCKMIEELGYRDIISKGEEVTYSFKDKKMK
jgi:uncharacterized Zn finger protein (UPF0148 family)